MKDKLTVGEVTVRSSLPVSTIHFYEAKGLIASERNERKHWCYDRWVLRRLAVIKVARRTGLSLDEIGAALAKLPAGRAPGKDDWAAWPQTWKADLDDRIQRLVHLSVRLGGCISCGCLSVEDCPLRNCGDESGHKSGLPDRGSPRRRLLAT